MSAEGDTEDRYGRMVDHFSDLASAWHQHRETINRAVVALSTEIASLRSAFQRDRAQREERQKELDGKLATIEARLGGRLDAIERLQRWRLRILVALLCLGCGLLVGYLFL